MMLAKLLDCNFYYWGASIIQVCEASSILPTSPDTSEVSTRSTLQYASISERSVVETVN